MINAIAYNNVFKQLIPSTWLITFLLWPTANQIYDLYYFPFMSKDRSMISYLYGLQKILYWWSWLYHTYPRLNFKYWLFLVLPYLPSSNNHWGNDVKLFCSYNIMAYKRTESIKDFLSNNLPRYLTFFTSTIKIYN